MLSFKKYINQVELNCLDSIFYKFRIWNIVEYWISDQSLIGIYYYS